jgi:type IV pilus assembly protein PilV
MRLRQISGSCSRATDRARSGNGARLKDQSGTSMVEVLTALVVVALGVLGVAKLQLAGIASHQNALLRVHATSLNNDLLDRFRADRAAVLSGDYDTGVGSDGLTQEQWDTWLRQVRAVLPQATAELNRTGNRLVITTSWRNAQGNGAPQTVTTATDI